MERDLQFGDENWAVLDNQPDIPNWEPRTHFNAYCMYVLMRAAVADFVDELLQKRRAGLARGSLRCLECGLFVGRRALGYGQLYCSERCKKRAAKRRYRGRLRMATIGPRLRSLR